VNLDDQLSDALKRRQPPPGLVERVMTRIESGVKGAAIPFWRRPAFALRLATAAVLVAAIGAGIVRQRDARLEQQRGEMATRQLMTALQIASEALNDAKRSVQ
jgi:hypothetical protein